MANKIVRSGQGALKSAGRSEIKKHVKKAPAKHAAKKHAKKAVKQVRPGEAADHPLAMVRGGKESEALRKAFHHMQRANAVISLVEKDSGDDLRDLLRYGIELYQEAREGKGKAKERAKSALGILRAAEHLGLAGLYAARGRVLVEVELSAGEDEKRLKSMRQRLGKLDKGLKGHAMRVHSMGQELLRRAEGAGDDPHMAWELMKAADGLCDALEAGEL